jgi:hypothetical protein
MVLQPECCHFSTERLHFLLQVGTAVVPAHDADIHFRFRYPPKAILIHFLLFSMFAKYQHTVCAVFIQKLAQSNETLTEEKFPDTVISHTQIKFF